MEQQQFKVVMIFDDGKKGLEDIEMVLPYVPREGEMFYRNDNTPYSIRGVSYWESKKQILIMAVKFYK